MANTRFAVGMQRKKSFYRNLAINSCTCLVDPCVCVRAIRKRARRRDGDDDDADGDERVVRFAAQLTSSGLVPWLGYHHVLMLLIAIAIILLCKSRHIPLQLRKLTCLSSSTTSRRLLINVSTHPGDLPDIPVLPIVHTHILASPGRPWSDLRNRQHRRQSRARSPCRLFRHLRHARWRRLVVLEQRNRARRSD